MNLTFPTLKLSVLDFTIDCKIKFLKKLLVLLAKYYEFFRERELYFPRFDLTFSFLFYYDFQ